MWTCAQPKYIATWVLLIRVLCHGCCFIFSRSILFLYFGTGSTSAELRYKKGPTFATKQIYLIYQGIHFRSDERRKKKQNNYIVPSAINAKPFYCVIYYTNTHTHTFVRIQATFVPFGTVKRRSINHDRTSRFRLD